MKQKLFATILALIVVVFLFLDEAFSAIAESYAITDLGWGEAYDINNLGQVVGSAPTPNDNAFFWDSDIGKQMPISGNSRFVGINDSGKTVESFQSILWDSNTGQTQNLPMVPYSTNNSDQVAGYILADDIDLPCIWDAIYGLRCTSDIWGRSKRLCI